MNSAWILGLAMLIRPVLLFVILACILLPARYAVIWWVPEGRIKRLLLFRL